MPTLEESIPTSGETCWAFSPPRQDPEPVLFSDLEIDLDVQPTYAEVGDLVTFTLSLRNVGSIPLEGATVTVAVPPELSDGLARGGLYDPFTGLLTIPLSRMELGAVLEASFTAHVTGQALETGHVLFWAEGSGGTLPRPVRAGTLLSVGTPANEASNAVDLATEQGGRLASADGRVAVDFPPGFVAEPMPLRVEHRPWGLLRRDLPPERWPHKFAGFYRAQPAFGLTARDERDVPVTTFDRPVTITVAYDPEEISALGMEEADLQLFWWDEDYVLTDTDGVTSTGLWVPIPSTVDFEQHVVAAAVDHFTDFTLSDGSSPSDAFLPGVEAFQVSLLTGSSTAGYAIDVPQGPGGLAPALSLSYSSAATDGKGGSRDTQTASWVGRGWSLGLDYIAVVKNPTTGGVNENTYSIVLNGVSSDLVVHNDSENGLPNPHYHPADEQYWAIWQANVGLGTHYKNGVQLQDTVWYVKTKDGTLYQFGDTTAGDFGNRSWWAYDRANQGSGADCGTYIEVNRWYLTKVTDTHANEMVYTYNKTSTWTTNSGCGSSIQGYTQGDVWPATIQWGTSGNRRFQVTFGSTARTNDLEYEKPAAMLGEGPHDTRQLNYILVQSMQATTWEQVRRYDFTYDYSLLPDNGHADHLKLTLTRIQMQGKDGTTLPATSFTYNMDGANYTNGKYRLQTVSNGYGGVVSYTYETFYLNGNYRNRVLTRQAADGQGHNYTWSYAYTNGADNTQADSAAIWYATNGAHDSTYLVHSPYSEFRGHREVVVTDPNLNKTEHWFYQGDGYDETHAACTIATWGDACTFRQQDQEALLGKEWKTISHSSSTSVNYTKNLSTFAVEYPDSSQSYLTGVRRAFSYLSQVVEYTYDGDATERHKTTQYVYDTSYQGGAQWGNLTHVKEYGGRDPSTQDPIRIKTQRYAINTGAWIVGAVVEEGLFAETTAAGNWQSFTYNIYDNQDPFDAPTVGNLTRVMKVKTLNTSTWLATTADVAYVYDSYGNRTTERVYNGDGSLTVYSGGSYTPATGDPRETVYTYDSNFHLYLTGVQYDYPGTHKSETAGYDYQMGLVTTYTDVNADTSQYRYDTFGRFSKMLQPGDADWAKPAVMNEYCDSCTPMMWRMWQRGDSTAGPWTANGTWKRQFYDGMGRLIQVQTPSYDWNTGGVGSDLVVDYTYDGLKQKTAESVPYAHTPSYNGSGIYYTPAGPNQTAYQYDPVGRVTLVTNPDGSSVQTVYSDWTTTTYDEMDHEGYQATDALGRLVEVREYTGDGTVGHPYTWYTTTRYDYNVRDQLTQTTDEATHHITFVYDKLGRQTELNDPDLGHWYYAYDNVGNMTRQTDAGGQRVCMYYDILNRLMAKKYWSTDSCPVLSPGVSVDVTFQYDNALGDADAANSWGKLRKAYVGTTTTANAHEYKYDTRGNTNWEQVTLDSTPYATSYTSDSMNRVRTMTYPDGEVVTNSYRPNGALNSASGVKNGFTTTYVGNINYTETGAVDKMYLGATAPGTIQVDYAYYAWNGTGGEGRYRLNWIKAGPTADLDGLLSLTYSYDLAGNISSIVNANAGQTQSFLYDDLGRVTSASANLLPSQGGYSEAYTYGDAAGGRLGNLTRKVKDGVTIDYTYGNQQSPCSGLSSTKPHGVWKTVGGGTTNYYCYDQDGNQVQRTVGGTTSTLNYDQENRLSSVSGGATASFTYGPSGERVKGVIGTSPAVTTYYIGNYYEKVGTTVRKYYYAGGARVAMREGEALYYLFSDHLGSTSITANSSGTKVAEVRYRAFGEDRYTSGTTPTSYRYTGQRQEAYINMYLMGFRWYDPALGRFTQPDTIIPQPDDPQQLNRYSYVENNPLSNIDPTGHRVMNLIDQRKQDWCTFHLYDGEAMGPLDTYGEGWTPRDTQVVVETLSWLVNLSLLEGAVVGEPIPSFENAVPTEPLDFPAEKPEFIISEHVQDYMSDRGWSPEEIQRTIENPAETHPVTDWTNGGPEPATGYVRPDGGYVIQNDATGVIIQASDLYDPGWLLPWNLPQQLIQ